MNQVGQVSVAVSLVVSIWEMGGDMHHRFMPV